MTRPGGAHEFPFGEGEMARRILAFDWASHPLGPSEGWPQGLKTGVRLLLSTGHPMFLWWGPELYQFYNDAYRRSIGPERHPSALGQRGRECWDEIWDIIGPQIELVMSGRGHTWHENQLVPITRYGRREDVYWTYSYGPIDEPGAPNGVGGVLVVCTETTEQVLSEQRLKAAESRWRERFEQAPGFMCILRGPTHVFEFANPRYFELVDGRPILGRTVQEALPEIEDQGFITLLDEVYRTGVSHVGRAKSVSLKTSRGPADLRYLDFVYQPIRDAEGEVSGVFVEGHDVTDRVLATEALRAEAQRTNEFLAMLAHELRNPLAPIAAVGELLAAGTGDQARHGQVVCRQVRQLTRLVDDLLDVSRITEGRIELQREVFDLSRALELTAEAIGPRLIERSQELTIDAQPGGTWLDADLTRIVQVLTNVVGNASKYSKAGAAIRLTARREDAHAVVEIRDEGIGIAPEMLPRVFELFVQGTSALDRTQGGMGIGLSVARRLVEMHAGRIALSSDGPERGTTVRIELPLAAPPAQARPTPTGPAPTSRRILVVDDNLDAAEMLSRLLRRAGHEVETRHAAVAAMERALSSPPEVVLLDIGLPDMDGYEVARRLRSEGFRGKVVAVTGYGRPEDVELALQAGFDAHITKPLTLADVERLLCASPAPARDAGARPAGGVHGRPAG